METLKEILKAHIDYRKQLFKLAKSDIIKTYKGAALGWAWGRGADAQALMEESDRRMYADKKAQKQVT